MSRSSVPPRVKRIIKRYSNRKLYDTRDSRYVTLLQVAEMVRSGEDVSVVDNNSKEDLTEVTLAQILYEEQKTKTKSVPLQTLRDLVATRTEKVLSDLREGPIGRLIPGATQTPTKSPGGKVESVTEIPARSEKAALEKVGFVEQAKGTLEDWQHKIDERLRAIDERIRTSLPGRSHGSDPQLPDTSLEIKRLQERLDAVEKRLREKGI